MRGRMEEEKFECKFLLQPFIVIGIVILFLYRLIQPQVILDLTAWVISHETVSNLEVSLLKD